MRGRQLGGKPRGGASSRCSKKAHHRVGEGGGKAQGLGRDHTQGIACLVANAGKEASTADVDQALEDYMNEQRKEHRGYGSAEVMNQLMEIKPDALGGLLANATPKEAEQFRARFDNWYQRFRRRPQLSICRHTSVGQKLPTGHEGMAWATLTKLRKALVERATRSSIHLRQARAP